MQYVEEKNILFLLGGYDLEMLTIRQLLQEQGVAYSDHQLTWNNACVSSYRKELEGASVQGRFICGIELYEDMPLPFLYKRIDHHNDYAHLPSSLEQILEILHLPTNRYLQLVAANDRGYIPAMLQLGATSEEIVNIRRADRQAQGVTDDDERLAESAIAESLERRGRLLIVRAMNSLFSPICDRLFPYQALLIYTDKEWMYYGEKAVQVRQCFANECQKGILFCGGGEKGYVGFRSGDCSSEIIEQMVKQIIRISE